MGVYLRPHELDQALNALRLIVRVEPRDADAHWDIGVILETRTHFREAMDAYQRFLRLRPGHEHAQRKARDLDEYFAAMLATRPYLGPIMDSQQNPAGGPIEQNTADGIVYRLNLRVF